MVVLFNRVMYRVMTIKEHEMESNVWDIVYSKMKYYTVVVIFEILVGLAVMAWLVL